MSTWKATVVIAALLLITSTLVLPPNAAANPGRTHLSIVGTSVVALPPLAGGSEGFDNQPNSAAVADFWAFVDVPLSGTVTIHNPSPVSVSGQWLGWSNDGYPKPAIHGCPSTLAPNETVTCSFFLPPSGVGLTPSWLGVNSGLTLVEGDGSPQWGPGWVFILFNYRQSPLSWTLTLSIATAGSGNLSLSGRFVEGYGASQGIAGLTVQVIQNGEVIAVTRTDSGGYWSYTLPSGLSGDVTVNAYGGPWYTSYPATVKV